MGKCLNFCALLLGSALIFGCATQKNTAQTPEQVSSERFWHNYETALKENDPATSQKLVKKAHSAIGTPYVLGGSKPGGFDCSGLVKWTYNSIGVELPRTAREQSTVGQKIKNVEDMRAGDIVAFKHPKRGYHTGIYVGDGKFIHSPRKRTRVRINSLDDPYFSKTLIGARRINVSASEQLVAQAESSLDQFLASRSMTSKTAESAVAKKSSSVAENKATPKSKVANSKKSSSKNVASNSKSKTSGKTVASNNKSKTSAKNAVKKGASKSVAERKTGNSKSTHVSTSKSRLKAVAQNNGNKPVKSVKKTVASKKTNNHKSVSMLQQKKQKTNTKSRNHS